MSFFRKFRVWHGCFLVLFLMLGIILAHQGVRAESLEEIEQQINDLQHQLELSVNATTPLESEVGKLNRQVESIQAQISEAERKTQELAESIKTREEEIKTQYVVLATKVRDYYKKSRLFSPWLVLISSQSASELTRGLAYKEISTNEDKNLIVMITTDIIGLENDKQKIERSREKLANLQTKLDKQKAFFEHEIAGAKKWQAELQGKIAVLSVKQKQLIAEKFGSLNLPTTLGAGNLVCTDDRNLNPGFSNAFAFYTYGIPHRVGLNQYGAYGRAKDGGQDAETILRAYFDNFEFVTGKEGETVVVNGTNEFGQTFSNEAMNIEDYLNHLHEMPSNWDSRALQAQAIAARSYALAIMRVTGSLRPSQKDQVVKKELNAQSWREAVETTRGKIMAQGGVPIKAWYASTSGGYTFNSGDVWSSNTSYTKRLRDTNGEVGGWGDLQNKAYDKDSPCFYAAQGWRNEYGKSAWLKASEVADIANVLMLAKKDSATQTHLSQVDKPNPDGVETWEAEKVRAELKARGGNPLETVSSISVSADFDIGKTTSISINGQSFTANEFVDYFNLRAPANIQIVGPLFNVERK